MEVGSFWRTPPEVEPEVWRDTLPRMTKTTVVIVGDVSLHTSGFTPGRVLQKLPTSLFLRCRRISEPRAAVSLGPSITFRKVLSDVHGGFPIFARDAFGRRLLAGAKSVTRGVRDFRRQPPDSAFKSVPSQINADRSAYLRRWDRVAPRYCRSYGMVRGTLPENPGSGNHRCGAMLAQGAGRPGADRTVPSSHPETKCAYAILLMAVYWMFELVHLSVTSLLPVFLFPILGILDTASTTAPYMKVGDWCATEKFARSWYRTKNVSIFTGALYQLS
ncbi:hypothetical protein HPB47_008544 [Ixodes persulcatus]|uniref:Uncharacterized protein n=1 Tax=Ixodes persulcatus TaxID=34615 RepID=A0AC60QZ60_IXOPE|nr:hypothetical protein HPB47_008544 [Ixodes persulcatus]